MEKVYNFFSIFFFLLALVASYFIRNPGIKELNTPACVIAVTLAFFGVICLFKRERVDATYRELEERNRRQHGI